MKKIPETRKFHIEKEKVREIDLVKILNLPKDRANDNR